MTDAPLCQSITHLSRFGAGLAAGGSTAAAAKQAVVSQRVRPGPAGLRGPGLRALGQRAVPAGAQLHAVAAAARERVLQRPQLQAARARRQRVPMLRGAPAPASHISRTLFWVPRWLWLDALFKRGSKPEHQSASIARRGKLPGKCHAAVMSRCATARGLPAPDALPPPPQPYARRRRTWRASTATSSRGTTAGPSWASTRRSAPRWRGTRCRRRTGAWWPATRARTSRSSSRTPTAAGTRPARRRRPPRAAATAGPPSSCCCWRAPLHASALSMHRPQMCFIPSSATLC